MMDDFIDAKENQFYNKRTLRILKQIGKSNIIVDKGRPAQLPGKRVSKNGKIYFETRRNRSDSLNSKT